VPITVLFGVDIKDEKTELATHVVWPLSCLKLLPVWLLRARVQAIFPGSSSWHLEYLSVYLHFNKNIFP